MLVKSLKIPKWRYKDTSAKNNTKLIKKPIKLTFLGKRRVLESNNPIAMNIGPKKIPFLAVDNVFVKKPKKKDIPGILSQIGLYTLIK